MDIELYVSQKGHIAFVCHGMFEKTISQIFVNSRTGEVSFIFKPDLDIWKPDCIVAPELCKIMESQLFCAIGYVRNGRFTAAEYVRFTCQPR